MATTIESKIKTIRFPQEVVFSTLSDLNKLSLIKDRIPQDKVKDMSFDTDSITVTLDLIGKITLRIINREPFKTLKFSVEGAPAGANMWIQLVPVAPSETKMKLTFKASINKMIKMMLKGKLEQFINGLADTLASLDYAKLQ